jgi:membrane-associated phospholipid phosphatase
MDERIFHLINQDWTNPFLDFFMPLLSDARTWTPVFVIIAVAITIFGGFRGRAFVFCTLIALAETNLVVDPLKNAFARPRPKQTETVRLLELQQTDAKFLAAWKKARVRFSSEADRSDTGASFPSGHVNNNTVIALCCTLFYRRWGKLYWLITAAVAYSRIYLGAHWPSDVFATVFLAGGETLIVLGLCELVWQKIIPKTWRQFVARHPRLVSSLPS